MIKGYKNGREVPLLLEVIVSEFYFTRDKDFESIQDISVISDYSALLEIIAFESNLAFTFFMR